MTPALELGDVMHESEDKGTANVPAGSPTNHKPAIPRDLAATYRVWRRAKLEPAIPQDLAAAQAQVESQDGAGGRGISDPASSAGTRPCGRNGTYGLRRSRSVAALPTRSRRK